LRIKEQETRLTLHEHDDDDDDVIYLLCTLYFYSFLVDPYCSRERSVIFVCIEEQSAQDTTLLSLLISNLGSCTDKPQTE